MSDSDTEINETSNQFPRDDKWPRIYWDANDSTINDYAAPYLSGLTKEDMAEFFDAADKGYPKNFKSGGNWYKVEYVGTYYWIKPDTY